MKLAQILFLLFLLFVVCSAAHAAPIGLAVGAGDQGEEMGPLLIPVIVLFFVFCIAAAVFLGVALAVGAVAAIVVGALIAVGLLSGSVCFAFIRRSAGSGFRAFFVQLGMIAGLPVGMCAMFLVSHMMAVPGGRFLRYGSGGFCGVAMGLGAAVLFNYLWGKLVLWMLGPARRAVVTTASPRLVDSKGSEQVLNAVGAGMKLSGAADARQT